MPIYPPAAFDLVDKIKEAEYAQWPFVLRPSAWHSFGSAVQFNSSKVKFDDPYINSVPDDEMGVYSFVVEPGIANHPACSYLVYIGMTGRQTFRDRYKQYLKEPYQPKARPRIIRMLTSFPDHLYFYYAPLPVGTDVTAVEDQLLEAYWPPVNKTFPAGVREINGGIF